MKLTKDRLDFLKSQNLKPVTASDIGVTIKDDCNGPDRAQAEARIAELNRYLNIFLPPKENGCVGCGAPQGAKDAVSAFLSGARFRWGLAHGEGFCSECGYPGRAVHRVGGWFTSHIILQYHPSALSLEESEPESEEAAA